MAEQINEWIHLIIHLFHHSFIHILFFIYSLFKLSYIYLLISLLFFLDNGRVSAMFVFLLKTHNLKSLSAG